MSDSPTRERIAEFARAHPGSSARAIQRGLDLSWGETAYHLGRLVRSNRVRRERGMGRDFYFDAGFPEEDRPLLSSMQSALSRAILVVLAMSDGLRFKEVVERVGEPKPSVSYHLKVLVASGLVEIDTSERYPRFRARRPDRVLEVHRRFGDSFEDRWSDRFAEAWGGLIRD